MLRNSNIVRNAHAFDDRQLSRFHQGIHHHTQLGCQDLGDGFEGWVNKVDWQKIKHVAIGILLRNNGNVNPIDSFQVSESIIEVVIEFEKIIFYNSSVLLEKKND